MARMARVMLAGLPFHVTHRGNHRRAVFLSDAHRSEYLALLRERSTRFGMRIWAYCLMPNHVHLLVVGERLAAIHPPETTRAILECLGLPSRAPPVAPARLDVSEAAESGDDWAEPA